MDQPSTVFRDIPGHPGYRAGDDGSISSRLGPKGSAGNPVWRKLSPAWNRKSGCLQVLLSGSTRQKCVAVGRLVLLAFVGPCPAGCECCHGEGGARDNRPGNLRWDTHLENMRDKDRHGTMARGVRSGTAKLDDDKVREIRLLMADGVSYTRIAARFGVSTKPVFNIAHGKSWRSVA